MGGRLCKAGVWGGVVEANIGVVQRPAGVMHMVLCNAMRALLKHRESQVIAQRCLCSLRQTAQKHGGVQRFHCRPVRRAGGAPAGALRCVVACVALLLLGTDTARPCCAQAVIHFWADWCQPCAAMDAAMAQLASSTPAVTFVRVRSAVEKEAEKQSVVVLTAAPPAPLLQLQVEAEEVDDLAMRYNVPSVPYFLLFKVQLCDRRRP